MNPLETALEDAFARGDFAAVRRRARAVLDDQTRTAEDVAMARRYWNKTEPPPAARFGLALTALVVLSMTLWFVLHGRG